MLEDIIEFGNLFDFYGNILNDSQKKVVELYYVDDLSLSEIGEELSITRQAAHDTLKRAERNLRSHEEKLQLLKRFRKNIEKIEEVSAKIQELKDTVEFDAGQKKIFDEIDILIDSIKATQ